MNHIALLFATDETVFDDPEPRVFLSSGPSPVIAPRKKQRQRETTSKNRIVFPYIHNAYQNEILMRIDP